MVCMSPFFVSAQDVITLKSGDEIQAKVTEVGQTEVKYKRFDNPDGPTYTVNKSDIFMVKYQNGQKDVFKDEQPAQTVQNDSKNEKDDGEFWKPYKWTNQRIAGISLFADLGGFCFTGSRYGLELRYRRWQVNGFFKYAQVALMNKLYLISDYYFPGQEADVNSAYGGGFTVKFLFPLGKSKSTLHVGVINEWTDYEYSFSNSGISYNGSWSFTKSMTKYMTAGATGLGFGYGYHTDKGFYFNLGVYLGIFAFNGELVLDEYRDYWTSPSRIRKDESWISFFGTAEVTLGWEFCLYRKK